MRVLRFAVRWGLPPLLAVAFFAIGYLVFYPGLSGSNLSDGSARSFEDTADRITKGKLLEKASPHERVAWLLEICEQPRSLRRDHALFDAFQQLQPADFLAAVADLPELSKRFTAMDGRLRMDVIEAAAERWMDVDEEGFLRWLSIARGIVESDALKLPRPGGGDLGAMYAVIGRRRPGWTFEQIQNLGPRTQRQAAVRALMRSAVEANLPQAGQWLASFKGSPDYKAAVESHVMAVSRSDPERALAVALTENVNDPMLAVNVVTECARQSPDRAPILLGKLEGEQRKKARDMMMGIVTFDRSFDALKWLDEEIERDPGLLETSDTFERSQFLLGITLRDAPKAMEWAQKFPESARDGMAAGMLQTWVHFEPTTALDWLIANPQSNAVTKLPTFGRIPMDEPERFAAWVASLPPGGSLAKARCAMAEGLLQNGKVTDAIRHFPADTSEPAVIESAKSFAPRLARENGREAANWLGKLENREFRDTASRSVLHEWMQSAPDAAEQWVESLPAGPLRDSAAGAMASQVAGNDFEAADALLAEIGDQRMRDKVATDVYASWHRRRPAQMREWLRSLPGVSETVRNRLLDATP